MTLKISVRVNFWTACRIALNIIRGRGFSYEIAETDKGMKISSSEVLMLANTTLTIPAPPTLRQFRDHKHSFPIQKNHKGERPGWDFNSMK